MISRETLTRPDGAEWTTYYIDHGCVVFTSRGREILKEEPDLLKKLRNYRRLVLGREALSGVQGGRNFFASGGNSDVYALDDKRVIKEAGAGTSLYFTLERLDTIVDVVETRTPRWIDVPDHYALLTSGNLDKQYMMMQRIDAGITVEDIVSIDLASKEEREIIESGYGGQVDANVQQEIAESFNLARDLIGEAFRIEGHNVDEYLTDYHEGNVLVERLTTPVAGSHHKLWIIDQ